MAEKKVPDFRIALAIYNMKTGEFAEFSDHLEIVAINYRLNLPSVEINPIEVSTCTGG